MIPCDYCHEPFEATRPAHRFCSNACRSAWHRENSLPGHVTGMRALKRGGWAITVRYPEQPGGVVIGSAVRLETTDIPRQDASTDESRNHP